MYVADAAAAPVGFPSGPLDGTNCAIPVCGVPGGAFTGCAEPCINAGVEFAPTPPKPPVDAAAPKALPPNGCHTHQDSGSRHQPVVSQRGKTHVFPSSCLLCHVREREPTDVAPKAFALPPKGAATADCQAPHTAQTYASGCAEGAKQSLTGSGMREGRRAQYGLKPGRMQEHLRRRLHQREADQRQNHQKHW